jgi:myo-inositol-1(or 4)-monophosphatase
MKPSLSEIEALARQAGALLRAGFRSDLHIDSKGTAIDLVTEMDRRSEELIISALRRAFPEHRIVAEESGTHGSDSAHSWYVDPLDGTVNYAHGIPIYSVSIAYAHSGTLQLGVVYDPAQDECFSAEHGCGAQVNNQPIRVSRTGELARSLLVTGFPYDIWTTSENNLENHNLFSLHSQGVRRLGSAALDLSYVAAGRFDGFWELKLSPWDIAAGALIAEEAGALVTAVDGSPDFLTDRPSILAANPVLHGVMLDTLGFPN